VETIGIERARAAGRGADLILYLMDATIGMTDDDRAELAQLDGKDVIVVYTKVDLAPAPNTEISISVSMDRGIEVLLSKLDSIVRDRFAAPEGSAVIVNERQRVAVAGCDEALRAVLESLIAGLEEQVILVDLYRASTALGLLTGAITKDEVFTEIFSRFCIGK
jgi:tRNA modification GTPase